MSRTFIKFIIPFVFLIRIAIAYDCKIANSARKSGYTFFDFKGRNDHRGFMPGDGFRLGFVSKFRSLKGNGHHRGQAMGHLGPSYHIDGSEEDSLDGGQVFDIVSDVESEDRPVETLVFSDFTDLYKNLPRGSIPESVVEERDAKFWELGDGVCDEGSSFSRTRYLRNRAVFIVKLFKKLPQIVETGQFLMRSKGYVKGRVGSKCDLSVFDSNRVPTAEAQEGSFESITSVLPGIFTGLHTLKHTKKRIVRELKVKLDLYVKALTSQIKTILHFYRKLARDIHPFQYNMMKTCLYDVYSTGRAKVTFEKILTDLSEARKQIIFRGNEINRKIGGIRRCRDVFNFVKGNIFELDSLYASFQPLYDEYKNYCSFLTRLPLVDIGKPIVSVIGHVNVGKTTLYNKLAQGLLIEPHESVGHIEIIADSLGLLWSTPGGNLKKLNRQAKVGDYKFTTRGINRATLTYKMNNFVYEGQLIDTPGLLWRRGHTNFNRYEQLTYSALKDVPSGVLFCFDLSGNNSLDDQVDLYLALKNRFPRRPWVNVIVQGTEDVEKVDILNQMGISTVGTQECHSNVQTIFQSLHKILNL